MGNWLRRARRTKVLLGCLLQPGQFDNQPLKSMLLTSIHLLNFVYRD